MAYYRKCRGCQCPLDPDEGNYCDECIAKMELREEKRKALLGALEEAAGGQMVIGGLHHG